MLDYLNINRIKKIDQSVLSCHSEEYDPFLVEKFDQYFRDCKADSTPMSRWVATHLGTLLDASDKLWFKHFSQEKLNCEIRSMVMEHETDVS